MTHLNKYSLVSALCESATQLSLNPITEELAISASNLEYKGDKHTKIVVVETFVVSLNITLIELASLENGANVRRYILNIYA